jgi:aspartyl-tRNA(Asn)/glutamyl-tRNA(Gln) amidotransferase subunit A
VLAGLDPPEATVTRDQDRFTIGVLTTQFADPSVTTPVRRALEAVLAALAAAGWELRELTSPWLDQPRRWEQSLAEIVAAEACEVHSGMDTSRYCAGTRGLLGFGQAVSSADLARAVADQAELTEAIEASLFGVDVLAGPTVGYQAPGEDPPFGAGDDHGEGRFTGPYNLSGHPAISLPVPCDGLPAGLQLAGWRGDDFGLLRAAAAAESVITAMRKD